MLGTALRVAATLASVAATSLAQQQEGSNADDAIVRTRSLSVVATPAAQRTAARATAMPFARGDEPTMPLDATGDAGAPQWAIQLLQQRHRGPLDDGSLRIDIGGGQLQEDGTVAPQRHSTVVFTGKRALVDAAVRDFDALAQATARPIEVTVHRLPLAEGPLPSGPWDPATMARHLQSTPPLWTSRARTRSGAQLRLGDQELRGSVADLAVEVAERATILDPRVDAAFHGMLADFVVHALPGESLQLSGTWLLSEQVASTPMPIAVAGDRPSVDQPDHRTAYASFAGTVLSGGALVVAGRGGPLGPAGFVLVVGARYLAPPAEFVAPDLLVRPVGAFLARPSAPLPLGVAWPTLGFDGEPFARHDGEGGAQPNELVQLLRGKLGGSVDVVDDMLVVRGDVAAAQRCNRLLAQLAADMATVQLTTRVVGDANTPPLELSQPVLGGHSAAAFVGRERMLIRDYEVEIAARAAASNPIVSAARSGLWLRVHLTASGAAWHADGSWSLAVHGEPRLHEHREAQAVVLQRTDVRTTTWPFEAPLPLDQDLPLGNGPSWVQGGTPTTASVRLSSR